MSSWKKTPRYSLQASDVPGLKELIVSWEEVQFSCLVLCDFLRPHGWQHARPPCPSPAPRVYSNSCPLTRWCHATISSFVVPFSSSPVFPSSRVFSNESILHIRWPKYWSFSISPSNKYLGLISFKMDWFALLAVQGTLKSFPAPVQKHQFFGAQLSL